MVGNLVRGAVYPLRGLGWILGDFRLLVLSAMPVSVGALLYFGFGWLLWTRSRQWFDRIWPEAESRGVIFSFLEGIRGFLYLVFVGLLILAAILSFVKVVRIVGAPFFDKMSLRTEVLFRPGFRDPGKGPSLFGEIFLEIQKFFMGLFYALVCVLSNFVIPGSGVVLGLYLGMYFLSMDFLGYAMNRRGLPIQKIRAFRRKNFGKVWGFSIATFFLLLTPILSLIIVPCCVVGGTLLYIENEIRD